MTLNFQQYQMNSIMAMAATPNFQSKEVQTEEDERPYSATTTEDSDDSTDRRTRDVMTDRLSGDDDDARDGLHRDGHLSEMDLPLPIFPEPVTNRPVVCSREHELQDGERFSAVTYNILADYHIRSQANYDSHREEVVEEVARHKKILRELQYLDGDVVAIQEVGEQIWLTFLLPEMAKLGYAGAFLAKKTVPEGVALLFRTDVFEMSECSTVYLGEVITDSLCPDLGLSPAEGECIKNFMFTDGKPLVAMRLKHVTSGATVVVGALHLSWTTYLHNDVNALEAAAALDHVLSLGEDQDPAFIILGDFNQEPHMPTSVFMTEGRLNAENRAELKRKRDVLMPDGKKRALIDIMPEAFEHSEKIESAYRAVLGDEPFPSRVDMINKFQLCCTVDYVFFSAQQLTPTRVWNLHPPEVAGKHGLPPDVNFPSDHMSLKAEFALSGSKDV